jgi:hypothetical protein
MERFVFIFILVGFVVEVLVLGSFASDGDLTARVFLQLSLRGTSWAYQKADVVGGWVVWVRDVHSSLLLLRAKIWWRLKIESK